MENKTSNIFVGIDYDEVMPGADPNESGTGGNYRAVTVSLPNEPEYRFGTGRPDVDYADAWVFVKDRIEAGLEFDSCFTLSSTTHFVYDVPGWRFNADDMIIVDHNDPRKALDA